MRVLNFFLLITLSLTNTNLYSQKESNTWYFGLRAGLDFNTTPPTVLTNGQINTREGVSSISDKATGQLLFYSEGTTVWNKNHIVMPNGTGLLGDYSSTQSSIAIPNPGNSNKYFLFTTALTKGVRYSEIDMTLNAGNGDIIPATKNTLLIPVDSSSEKLIAVRHCNGKDYWVITHKLFSSTYVVYPVNAAGVQAPIRQNIGAFIGDGLFWEGTSYLKISSDGTKLAHAIGPANSGLLSNVELLNFNNQTGIVSGPVTQLTGLNFPYGVEFSLKNKYLYVSENLGRSINQYDLNAANINASKIVITTSPNLSFGALQMGPDARIYVSSENGYNVGYSFLGTINSPEVAGAGCGYVQNSINLGTGKTLIGLPTFAADFLLKDSGLINFPSGCKNQPIPFSYSNISNVSSVKWDFGDASPTSTLASPTHAYNAAGTFTVTFIAYKSCSKNDTITKPITITNCGETIGNIINDYTPVLGFDPCKNILTVADGTKYNAGDTVLLMQMKGAAINISNTASFGDITSYQNAGNYEFNYVKSRTGNNIELKNILTRSYDIPTGVVQLIRVPYYTDAVVSSSLTCLPWDGAKGGVLVFNVQNSIDLQADIDVSGKGFQAPPIDNHVFSCHETEYFYNATSNKAAFKGEGIAVLSTNNAKGRGKASNAGGGGNGTNAGGGGGSNFGAGGIGGKEFLCDAQPQLPVGGLGGAPLTYSNAANKIFMGGSGGDGDENDNTGTAGGSGGGIVLINATSIKANTFKIISTGLNPAFCLSTNCGDGQGGGGAGGAAILNISNYADNLTINTSGGGGGSYTNTNPLGYHGPGGGGGGGVLWLKGATVPPNVTHISAGGVNGTWISNGQTGGALSGAAGGTVFNVVIPVASIPFKANIDSVRFNFSPSVCSFGVNFFGLAYVNTTPVATWQWYFGDGGTAGTQNTSHSYNAAGTYTVKLVVTDNMGCKDSVLRPVVITGTPNFDFSYKQDVCNPLSVQFFGEGATLVNPYWSFGDTFTNTGTLNPTHTYTSTGNYLVRFAVTNGGCNDTINKTISINVIQDNIVLTPDTTICFGSTKLLRAQASDNFCWTPTTYLNNPALNNPTTSTPTNITYYYTAEILGTNLIANPNFSAGNTGFSTDYSYAASNTLEGQYFVGPNPVAWNPGTAACTDHTSGTGNMLLVNGSAVPGAVVWKQTVTVTPNTNYNFACWAQSIYFANPAQLQFSINDILMGPVFSPGTTTCNWQRFFSNWNSGTNTTAVISVVNKNLLAGGNDFALDDISFAAVTIKRDSVKITVDTPVVAAIGAAAICGGTSVQLTASGAATYSWTPATGLSNPNIANPVATPSITTNYIVNGTTVNGCTAQASVLVTVLPPSNFDFSYQQDACNPLSVQFFNAGANPVNPFWSFGDATTLLGNPNPVKVYPSLGTYTVKYHIDNATCPDTITKVISLQVTTADIVFTPDTTICFGTTKLLRAQASTNFCWTPTTYLNNPALNNPTTSTPSNIMYSYTAEIIGPNLIPNGDFSGGNTGFTSDYVFQATNSITNAAYGITTNAQAWNTGASPCTDHTNGTGNMFVANGATTPGQKAWKSATINITPNTNYQFAAWIQSISLANFAAFKFFINGVQFGPTLNGPTTGCLWVQQKLNWNSGNNTTVSLSLEDFTYAADGNDFALDDISFAAVSIKRDSVKITVDTPLVNATGSTSVCSGVATQLNATGAATYSWSPVTGLSNPNIANPLATPTTTTSYTVTGTNIHGCVAQASVSINVLPKPVIGKSKDTTICKTNSVQLFASGGTTYLWSPAATLSNPNVPDPIATPIAPVTKYYVTVTNTNVNNCTNIDSVTVTLKADPVFTISPAKATCQGTPVQLNASGGDIYAWSPVGSVTNPAIPNPVSTANSTTNYSVTITESVCNISKILTTLITVNPTPQITATRSNDIDCSIEFSRLLASGASQYEWTPSTGLSSSTIPNPVAMPTATTQYIVKGTNSFGCSGKDTLTVAVSVLGKSGYLMPNSFTPNNDGLNDCFGIKYWGIIEQLEFFIYNRYGEKVFYTNDPNKCWDGLYKTDKPLPGNYVYYIKAKTACGTVERKGNVILIR